MWGAGEYLDVELFDFFESSRGSVVGSDELSYNGEFGVGVNIITTTRTYIASKTQ